MSRVVTRASRGLGGLLLAVGIGLGCGDGSVTLIVDLKTDLVPGEEFFPSRPLSTVRA